MLPRAQHCSICNAYLECNWPPHNLSQGRVGRRQSSGALAWGGLWDQYSQEVDTSWQEGRWGAESAHTAFLGIAHREREPGVHRLRVQARRVLGQQSHSSSPWAGGSTQWQGPHGPCWTKLDTAL